MTEHRVAALYVDVDRGPYASIDGVDLWGVDRDAAKYDGPYPVIAHPPCGPWGRLRHLCGRDLLAQEQLGPIAVDQVRRWGGVLEHPTDSKLWTACRMAPPNGLPDGFGGITISVEQWFWGHRAVKPTWLYIVRGEVPAFPGVPATPRPASGGRKARSIDPSKRSMTERLSKNERHLTPRAFALWLVQIARSVSASMEGQ